MGVSSQYTKQVNFNLSSLTELSKQEPKFTRTGYTFSKWFDGVNRYDNEALVNFNLDEVNLSAEWTINQYTVNWTIPTNGSIEVKAKGVAVENGGKVEYQTVLTITATANPGYKLGTLKVNGVDFISGSEYTVGDANVTISASFDDNTGIITYWPCY